MAAANSQVHREKTPLFLPPCSVCGGTATGLHFGAYTCEACKTFFRRALLNNRQYKCPKDGNCAVSCKRRSNCSACRLNKCFRLGMSKEAVKFGRYTVAMKTKTITDFRKIKGKVEVLTPKPSEMLIPQIITVETGSRSSSEAEEEMSTSPRSITFSEGSIASPAVSSTSSDEISESCYHQSKQQKLSTAVPTPSPVHMEEMNMADTIIAVHESIYPWMRQYLNPEYMSKQYKQVYDEHELKNSVFGNMSPLSNSEYQKFYKETGLDIDGRQELLQRAGTHIERSIRRYVSFVKRLPGIGDLDKSDVAKLVKAARFEFWFLGHYQKMDTKLNVWGAGGELNMHKIDVMMFKPEDLMNAEMRFAESLKRLKLSVEEVALLRAIVVMSKDRCDLKLAENVECLQLKYVACLERILDKFYDRPKQRLSALLDRLTAIRDLTEQKWKHNQTFINDWDLKKKFPLWTELLTQDDV